MQEAKASSFFCSEMSGEDLMMSPALSTALSAKIYGRLGSSTMMVAASCKR
jgi:hypothetical protein